MKLRGRQEGFTLIETLASLLVFSIVTLGIVPVILSAMNGANVSRSFTVGKNAALEAMERIRGLPYHVDYDRQPAGVKVDVLDLFFPDAVGGALPGQTYTGGLFTTRCTSSSANPACLADKLPTDLPNFQLIVRACFVDTGTECIDVAGNRAIPASYQWNPDAVGEVDDPPGSAQLMEISVTTSWLMGGRTRTYDARTLLGDKRFGSFDLRGRASINSAVEATTNFQSGVTKSRLTVRVGSAESDIQSTELRTSSTQTATSAELALLDTSEATAEATPLTGSPVTGASIGLQAPDSATATSGPLTDEIAHPPGHPLAALGDVGFFSGSSASGGAEVESELPAANGDLTLTGDDQAGLRNVADSSTAAELYLDTAQPLWFLDGAAGGLTASTSTEAADVATGGGVLSSAEVTIPSMRILPTTAISGDGTFPGETSVVLVEDFEANVECDVAADIGTSSADANWTADVYYWSDTTNDDEQNGSYTQLSLGNGLTNLLAPITATSDPTQPHAGPNPLVVEFEDPLTDPLATPPIPPDPNGHAQDVYLFPVTHDHGTDALDNPIAHDHPGYLDPDSGWAAQPNVDESVTDEGRTVDAAVNQALRFATVPLNTATADSFISVSVGTMACSSDDQR